MEQRAFVEDVAEKVRGKLAGSGGGRGGRGQEYEEVWEWREGPVKTQVEPGRWIVERRPVQTVQVGSGGARFREC